MAARATVAAIAVVAVTGAVVRWFMGPSHPHHRPSSSSSSSPQQPPDPDPQEGQQEEEQQEQEQEEPQGQISTDRGHATPSPTSDGRPGSVSPGTVYRKARAIRAASASTLTPGPAGAQVQSQPPADADDPHAQPHPDSPAAQLPKIQRRPTPVRASPPHGSIPGAAGAAAGTSSSSSSSFGSPPGSPAGAWSPTSLASPAAVGPGGGGAFVPSAAALTSPSSASSRLSNASSSAGGGGGGGKTGSSSSSSRDRWRRAVARITREQQQPQQHHGLPGRTIPKATSSANLSACPPLSWAASTSSLFRRHVSLQSLRTDQLMPVDRSVLAGTLVSGAQYLIRAAPATGNGTRVRVVIQVGAVHELPHERGAAAILALLAKQYLVDADAAIAQYLAVWVAAEYMVLDVTIPHTNQVLLESILRLVAAMPKRITVTPDSIRRVQEVCVEEYQRDRDGAHRVAEGQWRCVFYGTSFEDRSCPDPAIIRAATVAGVSSFRDKWLRLELMGIIVTGAMPSDTETRTLIGKYFDSGSDWCIAEARKVTSRAALLEGEEAATDIDLDDDDLFVVGGNDDDDEEAVSILDFVRPPQVPFELSATRFSHCGTVDLHHATLSVNWCNLRVCHGRTLRDRLESLVRAVAGAVLQRLVVGVLRRDLPSWNGEVEVDAQDVLKQVHIFRLTATCASEDELSSVLAAVVHAVRILQMHGVQPHLVAQARRHVARELASLAWVRSQDPVGAFVDAGTVYLLLDGRTSLVSEADGPALDAALLQRVQVSAVQDVINALSLTAGVVAVALCPIANAMASMGSENLAPVLRSTWEAATVDTVSAADIGVVLKPLERSASLQQGRVEAIQPVPGFLSCNRYSLSNGVQATAWNSSTVGDLVHVLAVARGGLNGVSHGFEPAVAVSGCIIDYAVSHMPAVSSTLDEASSTIVCAVDGWTRTIHGSAAPCDLESLLSVMHTVMATAAKGSATVTASVLDAVTQELHLAMAGVAGDPVHAVEQATCRLSNDWSYPCMRVPWTRIQALRVDEAAAAVCRAFGAAAEFDWFILGPLPGGAEMQQMLSRFVATLPNPVPPDDVAKWHSSARVRIPTFSGGRHILHHGVAPGCTAMMLWQSQAPTSDLLTHTVCNVLQELMHKSVADPLMIAGVPVGNILVRITCCEPRGIDLRVAVTWTCIPSCVVEAEAAARAGVASLVSQASSHGANFHSMVNECVRNVIKETVPDQLGMHAVFAMAQLLGMSDTVPTDARLVPKNLVQVTPKTVADIVISLFGGTQPLVVIDQPRMSTGEVRGFT